ncbi:MAG: TonB family protein [Alphaproteobacteria bacterium]|nr:MAG: TonB family protein [Alphaproteobacteria bacterium]
MQIIAALGLAVLMSFSLSANADPSGVALKNGVWRYSDSSPLFFHVGDTVPGVSNCMDECATVWATLEASDADAGSSGFWSIEKQPDGRRIWAYERKPVYRMTDPERTGYKGSSTLWVRAEMTRWLPPGVAIVDNVFPRRVLGMMDGRMLRTTNGGCNEECEANWLPFQPPADAMDLQDWLVSSDAKGRRIWAYGRADRHVYVEREPKTPASTPIPGYRYLTSSTMFMIRPEPLFSPTVGPIALPQGAYDIHDAAVVKAPTISPGVARPEYPAAAKRAGEEGGVTAQLCISSTGTVTDFKIVRSSGSPRLDGPMEAWLPTITFKPGFSIEGPVPICGYTVELAWLLQ